MKKRTLFFRLGAIAILLAIAAVMTDELPPNSHWQAIRP